MTATATATQPLTAVHFLFDQDQDTGQALAQTLRSNGIIGSLDGALGQLSQAGRRTADNQVASAVQGLLDLDLGGLMVSGWSKQGDLAAAAQRTAARPGSSEVVELASHRISSAHRPFVDLIVGEEQVARINFQLDIEFLVRALVATVRDGHVASLEAGSCEVTVTLAAEGVRLASRRGHLDPRLIIRWPLPLRPERRPGYGTPPG
jgi:hypothetical protein